MNLEMDSLSFNGDHMSIGRNGRIRHNAGYSFIKTDTGQCHCRVNIHVTRDFTKKRLFAGESLQIVEVIENRREAIRCAAMMAQPGDVILSVDGTDVSHTEEVLELRREKRIGDTMHLRIFRGDEIMEFDVTMMTNRY